MFVCLNFTISSNFSLIISLSFNLREPFIHLYFVHDRTPIYIQELLQLHTPSRNLRSSNRNLLVKPYFNLNSYGKRAFSVAAPELWNNLPEDILNLQTQLMILNVNLKHFFLRELMNRGVLIVSV